MSKVLKDTVDTESTWAFYILYSIYFAIRSFYSISTLLFYLLGMSSREDTIGRLVKKRDTIRNLLSVHEVYLDIVALEATKTVELEPSPSKVE